MFVDVNVLVLKRDMIKGGEKITYALNSVGLLLLNYKEKSHFHFHKSSFLHCLFFISLLKL